MEILSDEADGGGIDLWADASPELAGLAAASVQGLIGLGPRTGARPGRLGVLRDAVEPPTTRPCHAEANGFSLHAGLVVPAGQRDRLERVCRYLLRPPVAADRVQLTGDGQVRLALRHPWRDGTTAFVFDPVAFLGRLAVLVPRPRVNLLIYYGVLGARSAWRADVVRGRPSEPNNPDVYRAVDAVAGAGRGFLWAGLMARTFGFDVLACPQCGGRLRLVALIEQAAVIGRILRHLGLPVEIPPPHPPRAPPLDAGCSLDADWDGDPGVFAPCS